MTKNNIGNCILIRYPGGKLIYDEDNVDVSIDHKQDTSEMLAAMAVGLAEVMVTAADGEVFALGEKQSVEGLAFAIAKAGYDYLKK